MFHLQYSLLVTSFSVKTKFSIQHKWDCEYETLERSNIQLDSVVCDDPFGIHWSVFHLQYSLLVTSFSVKTKFSIQHKWDCEYETLERSNIQLDSVVCDDPFGIQWSVFRLQYSLL